MKALPHKLLTLRIADYLLSSGNLEFDISKLPTMVLCAKRTMGFIFQLFDALSIYLQEILLL